MWACGLVASRSAAAVDPTSSASVPPMAPHQHQPPASPLKLDYPKGIAQLDAILPNKYVALDKIPQIVKDLRSAFNSKRSLDLKWRKAQLKAFIQMINENLDLIAAAALRDNKKSEFVTFANESKGPVMEAQFALDNLDSWASADPQWTNALNQVGSSSVVKQPIGVALIIAPWNYPFYLALSQLAQFIAAGCAVLLKPSEVAPASAAVMSHLIPKYLDPAFFVVAEGAVPETSAILKQKFDHILYTGNGKVGRIVMKAASEHLTPVTLELGGKCPVFIDETANLTVAAHRIAWGKFLNAGQTCIAPDFVMCVPSVKAKFLDELKKALLEYYGPKPKESADYERVINGLHWKRLKNLLDGQNVVIGGEVDETENYIAPTVVLDPKFDSPVMEDEIFGPILPVLEVQNAEKAIEIVNARDRPLALYAFTNNAATQSKFTQETWSGALVFNDVVVHIMNPYLPFGGVGESGIGSWRGKYGFDSFSHHKAVMSKWTTPDPAIRYPPYTKNKLWIMSMI